MKTKPSLRPALFALCSLRSAIRSLLFALCALLLALCLQGCSTTRSAKTSLPFADHSKYGKYRTKQCKPVKQKQAWCYRQWGRN